MPEINRIARQAVEIEEREHKVSQSVWAKEILAETCGQTIEQLWDDLNAASNKLDVLAQFPAGEIRPPQLGKPQALPHSIQVFESAGVGAPWSAAEWKEYLRAQENAGWALERVEFRHLQFDTDKEDRARQSRYYCSAHLSNTKRNERAIVEGDILVDWHPARQTNAPVAVQRVDASRLTVRMREGNPPFRQVLAEEIAPLRGSFFIDPLILYDLDGDGLSEVILAAKNLVLHRRADGQFESMDLCRHSPGLIFTGVIADFDGDGFADFLCAKFEGLYLFKGAGHGTFNEPGRLVWAASPHLKYAQVLTCADIDGDGDLDVWLGQYKLPYDRGQMPTPYYDANDGYPSYLLANDGHGRFTDATAGSGLVPKRWRRAYSGSFIDLNHDGRPDLLVACDFAGADLYLNEGGGRFTDATRTLLGESRAFGMSQLCADFNADGREDILLVGMNVPVMDRLLHFGRPRPGAESYLSMGAGMVYGNRLLLGQENGTFQSTVLSRSVARTGWSWGAAASDFDNDGFPDLYIVNGHDSRASVRDYETEFWLHDIYVGNSKDDLAVFAYFQTKFARTRGRGMSYGGYEKNRFFLNRNAEAFVEAAHLMGLGLEADSRNVVADDLDGDGRMDVLLTTFEAYPRVRQTLQIYRNELASTGNWIGFRLRERGPGRSPVGARITIEYGGHKAVRQIVTGDSYRCQQPWTAHFGLGQAQQVDRAEVRWPNGERVVLERPAVNQYHRVDPAQL